MISFYLSECPISDEQGMGSEEEPQKYRQTMEKHHVGGIAALADRGEASVGKLAIELLAPWIGGA
jgi:hypothetical protein